ncbi:hypothetical protein JA1_005145 [Spathaspora sp. JA1]|nr:hypothetical protein JA1_005145 [Spathaspora sp. JA1]
MSRNIPPIFIYDIITSPPLSKIYFQNAWYLNLIIINNFPISKVRVFGRIIGEVYRSGKANSKFDFILIQIDDCSGSSNNSNSSSIFCKIKLEEYTRCELNFNSNYGKIVEITGTVVTYGENREIHCESMNIIGKKNEFSVEVKFWQERMDYRKKVLEPGWVFVREKVTCEGYNNDDDVVRFDTQETTRRQRRAELVLSDENDVEEIEEREDSMIIYVNEESPVQIITNLQLTIEIIRWIIISNFIPFKLAKLFHDKYIANLVDILTETQLATIQIGNNESFSFEQARKIVFQRIRHDLQINMNLISVTKSQTVYSDNLHALYKHLKTCLVRIRQRALNEPEARQDVLDVLYYLSVVKHHKVVGEGLGYKLVNAMVDYITVEDLQDRGSWRYYPKSIEWSYIGSK